ncbi:LacI family DNA-binding transcriptional regulator [Martelella sp. AMO21009]
MAKSIGIRDVARHAGVSTATVSRALNNPDTVSAALRDKIRKVIEEIGYIPDASARALSSRRTRTIGAIVPTVDNAMFAQGLQALQSYLATQNYLLLLATNEYDLDVELEQARNLAERGIDGLILRGDRRHAVLRRMLDAHRIPFVNVGVYEPEKPYPSVGVDNAEAGRTLARYITGLGHRRIAIVAAQQRNNDRAAARLRGILDVLEAEGCAPPDKWILQVNYALDDARDASRALLMGEDRPTAVICGNDVIAYGVMLSAIRMGVSVPDQLSVAGFDDLEWSRHLQPSLTTIHIPTNEIWVRAGRYLVNTLNDEAAVMHQKVDFSLVVRESTAPPPG